VSEINKIKIKFNQYNNKFNKFQIDKSRNGNEPVSGIFPPDIGICPDCLNDMNNPNSRWFEYPFTACAWCGPRFSGIKSLPYDRERTHQDEFPLCKKCTNDYNNSLNRRFDAQGITCPECGPKMSLFDSIGLQIESNDVFYEVGKLLLEGNIIAIKGIGGVHLSSLATEDDIVNKLRIRKKRPNQPFALMSPNIKEVTKFTDPNKTEIKILTNWKKPIILLKKKGNIISDLVAPGLDRVGVMLPYSGIQQMVFKKINVPALIMTSGNPSGLPMIISNDDAFKKLNKIADYFLLHNRKIFNRCDDSLLRINHKKSVFLRRSRGYIPDPIKIPKLSGIAIGVGAELANSSAITRENKCFLTQFLGDITTLEALEYEEEAINFMYNLLKIKEKPDVITCDANPGYMTSHLALKISQDLSVPLIKSQHHHAHIVSACAENLIDPDEKVIGVALDGAGYGLDTNIWGCEVLISTYSDFERAGSLQYTPMPGGDLSSIYPYRMLIAQLSKIYSDDEIRDITLNHINEALPNGREELDLVLQQCKKNNSIKTSSAGRFLDSISALLGLCYYRTYEGEPAMKLESHAVQGNPKLPIKIEIEKNKDIYELKIDNLIKYFINYNENLKSSDIASISQNYLVEGLNEVVLNISDYEKINKIILSGGVFVNKFISNKIYSKLQKNNKKIFLNQKCPSGDGGISLGQTCIGLRNVM
ncbi:carbamoyltransferase HypF, partial [Candidatus Bathyarchaeota archaeon]|nr:carbamoyltransferase HypF [Candidatus Bathyarchaeota archaeon]